MIKLQRWKLLAAAIIFIASFCFRLFALHQTSYANGWDGYFYINQVKAFFEEGRMHVADASLIYPILISSKLFIGDYILAFKITCALLAALFSISAFNLSFKWSESLPASILIGSYSVFSPQLTYFAAQYPKNLLGLIFFLWLITSFTVRMKISTVLLLALNFFGHRITAVLGFVFVSVCMIYQRLSRFRMLVLACFVLFLLIAGLVLPGLLNYFDLERFSGMFSLTPHFSPLSFLRTFGPELISKYWLAEVIIAMCAYAGGVAVISWKLLKKKQIEGSFAAFIIILSLLVFPFFTWTLEGPSFRFVLIFILLSPLLISFALKAEERKYLHVASLSFLALSFVSFKSYFPAKHDPRYNVYERVSKQILISKEKDSYELIIAHKSLAEYIVFKTGIEAMSWIPEYKVPEVNLWRVAADVKDVQLKYYLLAGDLTYTARLTPSYTLIREDIWNKFLREVNKRDDQDLLSELLSWKNPSAVRPAFLLKNKQ